jgi:hypothetical protein
LFKDGGIFYIYAGAKMWLYLCKIDLLSLNDVVSISELVFDYGEFALLLGNASTF